MFVAMASSFDTQEACHSYVIDFVYTLLEPSSLIAWIALQVVAKAYPALAGSRW